MFVVMVIFGVVVRLNGVYVFKIMANITVKQKILDALQLFYNKLKEAEIGDLTATGISGNTIADQLSTLNSNKAAKTGTSYNAGSCPDNTTLGTNGSIARVYSALNGQIVKSGAFTESQLSLNANAGTYTDFGHSLGNRIISAYFGYINSWEVIAKIQEISTSYVRACFYNPTSITRTFTYKVWYLYI